MPTCALRCALDASTKGTANKSALSKHIAKNNNAVHQLGITLNWGMPVQAKVTWVQYMNPNYLKQRKIPFHVGRHCCCLWKWFSGCWQQRCPPLHLVLVNCGWAT